MSILIEFHQWQKRCLIIQLVGFVQQQQRRFGRMSHQIQNEPIATAGRHRSVSKQANEIDAFKSIVHRRHHSAIKLITRLVDTRRVDQNDLSVGPCDDSLNSVSSRLWFIGNRGDLFTHQTVQKRAFAGVETSDQGDIARAEFHRRNTFLHVHV